MTHIEIVQTTGLVPPHLQAVLCQSGGHRRGARLKALWRGAGRGSGAQAAPILASMNCV